MLFDSFSYLLIFLPVVVIVAIFLKRLAGPRTSQVWVLLASVFLLYKK